MFNRSPKQLKVTPLKQMVMSLHQNQPETSSPDGNTPITIFNDGSKKGKCFDDDELQDQRSMINDEDGDDDWYHKEMNDIASKKLMYFSSNWKDRNRCMKCNEGGWLLVCSTKSCSFPFHDSCLVSNTNEKFYCPFCKYSQLISDYRVIKRKASLARNDVASLNGLMFKNIPQMSHKRLCVSEQIKPCTTFPQRRRVPVPWTKLEEDTLKLLVLALQKLMEKFSQESDGGFIPWSRILELGGSVFQKGRTPVDLKDKWRNMQNANKKST